MKQLNVTVAGILVLVYLLVVLGGAPEYILCVGEDGHAGIKMTEGGSCDDPLLPNSPSSQSSAEDSLSSDENHCGPCVDVPVPLKDSLHKSVSGKHSIKHMWGCATLAYNLPALSESIARGTFSARPLETNSTLHSIRTIVLLI